jgi:hypothetical protein
LFTEIKIIVVVIIIIIIINGKTALFEPWPSLEDSARLRPVVTYLDFTAVMFLHNKIVSFASNAQPGGTDPCIYVPQWQGIQLYPQGPCSLFIAFCDS